MSKRNNEQEYMDDFDKWLEFATNSIKFKEEKYLTFKQSNFSIDLHTFFRKYLDSKTSIIIWNAIAMIELEWILFIKGIYGKKISKELFLKYTPCGKISFAFNLLHHAFDMLTDEEYKILNDNFKGYFKRK